MDLTEFRIGAEFTTGEGRYRWRCTDIGTRTVAAIRVDEMQVSTSESGGPVVTRTVPGPEAEALGYFDGPPYMGVERLFDESDQEVCEPV